MELNEIKKIIAISKNKKDVIAKLNLKYNFRSLKKINNIIKELNIDISHFVKTQYLTIKKICPKCNIEFENKNGGKESKLFCSRSCANSRIHDEKTKNKISESLKKKYENVCIVVSDELLNKLKLYRENFKRESIKKILEEDFNLLSWERKRKRILYEQNYCCHNCGNNKWMGNDLVLEIEHIDGCNNNDLRNNLKALCPNCHSLTKTWRGRNKKTDRIKITDELLLEKIIENNFNFRRALISVGLSAKGGNYGRCHKLKREYDIICQEFK